MNVAAETIKEHLSMREVAEYYGFTVNRSGCIQCPFHAGDHQASLHIYPENGGFCCFGCDARGSVIDFTMKLFECSFGEAMQKINTDFALGIDLGRKLTYRERKRRQSMVMAASEQSKKLIHANGRCSKLLSLFVLADTFIRLYNPDVTNSFISGYCWAAKNIDAIKYELLSEEERRWKLEQASRYPGLGERKVPNP